MFDAAAADGSAGAGNIDNDQRFGEQLVLCDRILDQSRENVAPSAGAEGHNQFDRPTRVLAFRFGRSVAPGKPGQKRNQRDACEPL